MEKQLSIADIKLKTVQSSKKKRNYTITDKARKNYENQTKKYGLSDINKKYYELFRNNFDKVTSWSQYKVHCGDLLEQLSEKDFAMVTVEDIENYVNDYKGSDKTKANCKAHIRSMMIYVVKNNIENARVKVSKEMLIYLI